jgi:hypothetical protein
VKPLEPSNVALSAGDLAALDLLQVDRDEGGPGVPLNDLEAVGLTRYVGSLVKRLHAHGHLVGVSASGLYELGHGA